MLRDRLVCGINNEQIQRKLLSEPELTYKKVLELAQGLKAATKNLCMLKYGNWDAGGSGAPVEVQTIASQTRGCQIL